MKKTTKLRTMLLAATTIAMLALPAASAQASHPCHEDEPPASCSHDTGVCWINDTLADTSPTLSEYVNFHCV